MVTVRGNILHSALDEQKPKSNVEQYAMDVHDDKLKVAVEDQLPVKSRRQTARRQVQEDAIKYTKRIEAIMKTKTI